MPKTTLVTQRYATFLTAITPTNCQQRASSEVIVVVDEGGVRAWDVDLNTLGSL